MVPEQFRRAHARPDRGVGRNFGRATRPRRRTDRIGQDPGRLPLGSRLPGQPVGDSATGTALPGPLRLPTQGAGHRRPTQPPGATGRHRAGRGPPGTDGARGHRGGPLRRHLSAAAAPARDETSGHPHHHPGVALPHAYLSGAQRPGRGRDGHHRRGPCGRGDQTRGTPRALLGATRRAPGPAGPADRAECHRRAGGRGGPLPGRGASGQRGPAPVGEALGPQGRRPGRGPRRPRRADRRPQRTRGRRAAAHVDLAPCRGAHRRPHRRAPLDSRLRQLPASRRTTDRTAQRGVGRPAGGRRGGHRSRSYRLPRYRLARYRRGRCPRGKGRGGTGRAGRGPHGAPGRATAASATGRRHTSPGPTTGR